MKKTILFILLSCFTFFHAQSFIGSWKGELQFSGVSLPIIFHIAKDSTSYSATFDSPKQGVTRIPFDFIQVNENTIELKHEATTIKYQGELSGEMIKGTFHQNRMQFPLHLERLKKESKPNRPQTPQPPFDYNSIDIKIKNEEQGNTLGGTLVTPKNSIDKNFPIVIMITGSGTQDRNESLFEHQPFLVIADYLANNGIGSLRMDDRGMGGSEKGKDNPTTADFVTDINSAVEYLSKLGYTNIGLLGHSEGGMIAPMVALKNKNIRFQVLLAAPGVPIRDLLIKQNENILKLRNTPKEQIDLINNTNSKIYDFLLVQKNNITEEELNLWAKANLSFPLPENQLKQLTDNWFQYFIKFRSENYLSKIKIPTLAINGKLDRQVSSKENLQEIEKSLKKAGNTNYKIMEFEGLNHLFQHAKTGSPDEYYEIEETIAPKVLETIKKWIESL